MNLEELYDIISNFNGRMVCADLFKEDIEVRSSMFGNIKYYVYHKDKRMFSIDFINGHIKIRDIDGTDIEIAKCLEELVKEYRKADKIYQKKMEEERERKKRAKAVFDTVLSTL